MKSEHVLEFSRPDIEGHTIKAVKVIGLRSRHGWSYSAEVLKEALPLYEASPVFIEHPDEREKKKGHRQLGDHFGSLENVRGNGEGLFADLKIRQSHPLAKQILEAAPTARFGLSHNAVVDLDEDKTKVLKIHQVNSVDLVNNPATNANLFEESDDDDQDLELSDRLDAIESRIDKLVQVMEAAAKTRPKRLVALEDGDSGSIGDKHADFMDALRGFKTN